MRRKPKQTRKKKTMQEAEIKELAQLVAGADWYYNHSDDYSAYNRGSNQVSRISQLFKQYKPTDEEVQKIKDETIKCLAPRFDLVNNIVPEQTIKTYSDRIDYQSKNARS